MNGRAALAAGKDDYTSDEEDDEPRGHKFRRNTDKADTMKILLESMYCNDTVLNILETLQQVLYILCPQVVVYLMLQ